MMMCVSNFLSMSQEFELLQLPLMIMNIIHLGKEYRPNPIFYANHFNDGS